MRSEKGIAPDTHEREKERGATKRQKHTNANTRIHRVTLDYNGSKQDREAPGKDIASGGTKKKHKRRKTPIRRNAKHMQTLTTIDEIQDESNDEDSLSDWETGKHGQLAGYLNMIVLT